MSLLKALRDPAIKKPDLYSLMQCPQTYSAMILFFYEAYLTMLGQNTFCGSKPDMYFC